jgi:hypothetical protein
MFEGLFNQSPRGDCRDRPTGSPYWCSSLNISQARQRNRRVYSRPYVSPFAASSLNPGTNDMIRASESRAM